MPPIYRMAPSRAYLRQYGQPPRPTGQSVSSALMGGERKFEGLGQASRPTLDKTAAPAPVGAVAGFVKDGLKGLEAVSETHPWTTAGVLGTTAFGDFWAGSKLTDLLKNKDEAGKAGQIPEEVSKEAMDKEAIIPQMIMGWMNNSGGAHTRRSRRSSQRLWAEPGMSVSDSMAKMSMDKMSMDKVAFWPAVLMAPFAVMSAWDAAKSATHGVKSLAKGNFKDAAKDALWTGANVAGAAVGLPVLKYGVKLAGTGARMALARGGAKAATTAGAGQTAANAATHVPPALPGVTVKPPAPAVPPPPPANTVAPAAAANSPADVARQELKSHFSQNAKETAESWKITKPFHWSGDWMDRKLAKGMSHMLPESWLTKAMALDGTQLAGTNGRLSRFGNWLTRADKWSNSMPGMVVQIAPSMALSGMDNPAGMISSPTMNVAMDGADMGVDMTNMAIRMARRPTTDVL